MYLRPSTWNELFDEFYGSMCRYAKSLTRRNDILPEDLVHDAVVRLLTCPHQPSELTTPHAYVIIAMKRVFIDSLRKTRNQVESLDDPQNLGLQSKLVSQSQHQRDLERQELLDAIRQESPRLSTWERLLLELLLDGRTCEDIAEILNEDIRIISTDCNKLKAKLRYRLRNKF